MSEPIMRVKGTNGQVELYENKIKITRKGVLASLSFWGRGSKEIPLDSIRAVQFKKPGMATNGYIQFEQSGYDAKTGGTFSAAKDENSVTFTKKKLDEFRQLKSKIDDLRNQETGSSDDAASDTAIETLQKRFAKGEISEDEYNKRLDVLKGEPDSTSVEERDENQDENKDTQEGSDTAEQEEIMEKSAAGESSSAKEPKMDSRRSESGSYAPFSQNKYINKAAYYSAWGLGILFVFASIGGLATGEVGAGAGILLQGLLLIPLIRSRIREKVDYPLKRRHFAVLFIVSYVLYGL